MKDLNLVVGIEEVKNENGDKVKVVRLKDEVSKVIVDTPVEKFDQGAAVQAFGTLIHQIVFPPAKG